MKKILLIMLIALSISSTAWATDSGASVNYQTPISITEQTPLALSVTASKGAKGGSFTGQNLNWTPTGFFTAVPAQSNGCTKITGDAGSTVTLTSTYPTTMTGSKGHTLTYTAPTLLGKVGASCDSGSTGYTAGIMNGSTPITLTGGSAYVSFFLDPSTTKYGFDNVQYEAFAGTINLVSNYP